MGPLPEPTFLVLAALAGEPQYGYGIIRSVAELSVGGSNSGPARCTRLLTGWPPTD